MTKSIYNYADKIDNNKHITFCDVYKTLLNGIDCIVCKESAADLLGYSNGGFRRNIDVYTLHDYNLPYLNCHVVDNFSKINVQDFHGIKVVPIEQTIIELLQDEKTDDQIQGYRGGRRRLQGHEQADDAHHREERKNHWQGSLL